MVIRPDKKAITIDVKGLKSTSNWPVSLKRNRPNHFFIFVCFVKHFEDLTFPPEAFIVPANELHKYASEWSNAKKKVACVNYRTLIDKKLKNNWPRLLR